MNKTHHCNQLRAENIDQEVSLRGWVDRRRDHGGVIFIDLRDREGKTQIVFNPDFNKDTHAVAEILRNECVVWVKGTVRSRPEGMKNPKMDTGDVDVYINELNILNTALNPPIAVNDAAEEAVEGDDVRLKYRYLDLRRPREQRLIRLKSKFLNSWRQSFEKHGFDEIETPILMKSTPEGARDFLTPSRMNPGNFYALPQSPQTYKQLLMIAGFEKYYQVAKCFRDEDLRADRQPEFLQLDCEMSFVECEDIYQQFETIIAEVTKEIWGLEITTPFKRMEYEEAMLTYGSDKPDLRYELHIKDVSDIAESCSFKVFQEVVKSSGVVRSISINNTGEFTGKVINDLISYVGKYGAKGLAWMKVGEDGFIEKRQVAKMFSDDELLALKDRMDGKSGDILFFIADKEHIASNAMGHLRVELARIKNLTEGKGFEFLWVVNFPMFEYSETEKRYTAMHHPFTSPHDEYLSNLSSDNIKELKAKAYDLVINGVEVGGGSIRIHQSDVQEKVFELLGLSKEEVDQKFGYFVEAFKYGAPPHGGIAFGVDRFLATLEHRDSIRGFIPFPKTSSGTSLMDGAPSEVDDDQLRELHVRVTK